MVVPECLILLPMAFNLNYCLHSQHNSPLCWIHHGFGGKNGSVRPFMLTNAWIKSWDLNRSSLTKYHIQLSPKISEVIVEFIIHSSEVFSICKFIWVCLKSLMIKFEKQILWGSYLYIKYLLVNKIKKLMEVSCSG